MRGIPETIGRYLILERIGRGAMGVVYLARDRDLDRDVAIKALPGEFASDPQRLERFRREARALAALNHPNIAAIHHLLELEREIFLVLEYVPGRLLSDEINSGPLPLVTALRYGRQIAAALDAAHQRGVIHRDLKPSNIKITPRKQIKVLDFGLARFAHDDVPDSRLPARGTAAGVIMGTPGYMAPEQVRGEPADRQADIFSFGCVLFELLCGAPAYCGQSANDIMAATLRDDPPWALLRPAAPRTIDALLRRCLQRDPEVRLRDVGDALIEIDAELERLAPRRSPTSFVADASRRAHRGNLLPELTAFIGRERELRQCISLLRSTRLLTLTGVGGSGKTRLARRIAHEIEPGFEGGAWMVELASLDDPDMIAQAVGSMFGLQDSSGAGPREQLIARLADEPTLLIIDNCEHVLDGCAQLVRMLLNGCPDLRIIATSREALHVPGEQRFRVPSLAVPNVDSRTTADAIAEVDSVKLFIERVRLIRPDFTLDDRAAPEVARICCHLDGIPLAIELAAARVRSLTVRQIADRLEENLDILRTDSRSGLERHQTLQATIDWSYTHLLPAERLLFRRLSIFRGGWTLEAAEAVCGDSCNTDGLVEHRLDSGRIVDLLAALVDKSMVTFEPSEGEHGRYNTAEPLRQDAALRLAASDEHTLIRSRHLHYFASLVHRAEPHLAGGAEQTGWLHRIAPDHDNIRAALAFGIDESEHVETAARLVHSMHRFWLIRGFIRQGIAWLERLRSHEDRLDVKSRGHMYADLGILCWSQGLLSDAQAHYEHSLPIWRSLDDQPRIAALLANIGVLSVDGNKLDYASTCLDEARVVYSKLGDDRGVANVDINRCNLMMRRGAFVEALPLLECCQRLFEEHGDTYRIAYNRHNLAICAFRLGRLDDAAAHLRAALPLLHEIGDTRGTSEVIEWLARIAHANDDVEHAGLLLLAAESLRTRNDLPTPSDSRAEIRALVQSIEEEVGDRFTDLRQRAGELDESAVIDLAMTPRRSGLRADTTANPGSTRTGPGEGTTFLQK